MTRICFGSVLVKSPMRAEDEGTKKGHKSQVPCITMPPQPSRRDTNILCDKRTTSRDHIVLLRLTLLLCLVKVTQACVLPEHGYKNLFFSQLLNDHYKHRIGHFSSTALHLQQVRHSFASCHSIHGWTDVRPQWTRLQPTIKCLSHPLPRSIRQSCYPPAGPCRS